VRLARNFATGLYLFGFAAGLLTLGGGCGGGTDEVVLVPAKEGVSDEERAGRMKAMKEAEAVRRQNQ